MSDGRDVRVGLLLEGQLDVEADRLGSGLVGSAICGLHDAGTSAGGDDEAMAGAGEGLCPGGEHVGEDAGVLVVGGHLDGGPGETEALAGRFSVFDLFERGGLLGGGLTRARVGQQLEVGRRHVQSAEACGAEEDDRVLNAFAPEAAERLLVLGHDAKNARIRRVEEVGVLVR